MASGYRTTARIAAAAAGSRTESAGKSCPAPFIMLPAVSKGLPPPLPSSRFVCELPAPVVVFVCELVGLFVLSCTVVLLLVGGALDDTSGVDVCFVGFWVLFVLLPELVAVVEVSTSKLFVSVGFRAVVVLLTIDGFAVVVCCVDVCDGVVVVSVEAAPALWHICCGPTPLRKATIKFCP